MWSISEILALVIMPSLELGWCLGNLAYVPSLVLGRCLGNSNWKLWPTGPLWCLELMFGNFQIGKLVYRPSLELGIRDKLQVVLAGRSEIGIGGLSDWFGNMGVLGLNWYWRLIRLVWKYGSFGIKWVFGDYRIGLENLGIWDSSGIR